MDEIFQAIAQYARAYAVLEELQRRNNSPLPIGDQKTGVIAEFYARLYAQTRYPGAAFEYGSASKHAWDLKVRRSGRETLKIQVKAVSWHSKTSRISPIHPGWHELWLMRLDKTFLPEGFWIIRANGRAWAERKLANKTMPRRGVMGTGSKEFMRARDHLDALRVAIRTASKPLNTDARQATLPGAG